MLFSDPDIEASVRKLCGEGSESGSLEHGCRDGDNTIIFLCQVGQGLPEDRRVTGRAGASFLDLTRSRVKRSDTVKKMRVFFSRGIALALLGHHVHENRAIHMGDIFQCRQ